jgi:CheY-like chemotaxis protein
MKYQVTEVNWSKNKERTLKMNTTATISLKCSTTLNAAYCKTLGLFGFAIVDDAKSANVVITNDLRTIYQIYRADQTYVLIPTGPLSSEITKENIIVMDYPFGLLELANLIGRVGDKLVPATALIAETAVTVKPGAPWVLVVDDKIENREAAKQQLCETYNLTVVDDFDEARVAFKSRKFDFALLDLHLPVSTEGALAETVIASNLGEGIPYGMFLLFSACETGADAAVVTDLSHHSDPFSAAFDYYDGKTYVINGKKGMFQHASMIGEAKNWLQALERLQK